MFIKKNKSKIGKKENSNVKNNYLSYMYSWFLF